MPCSVPGFRDHDLSQKQTLNQLSHPHIPAPYSSDLHLNIISTGLSCDVPRVPRDTFPITLYPTILHLQGIHHYLKGSHTLFVCFYMFTVCLLPLEYRHNPFCCHLFGLPSNKHNVCVTVGR